MNFWRTTALSAAETALLSATLDAHARSAQRDNISSVVVAHAGAGSGDFTKAVIAALSTLGGTHAPLHNSYAVLQAPLDHLAKAIAAGVMLPGWGNSFEKGRPDPTWAQVDEQLRALVPDVMKHVDNVTALLHEAGKLVYPNPSIYTAAAGLALGIPQALLPWLFIQGRLAMWAVIFHNATKGSE